MGNSEVGHLNIGAGRVVYQELTRIDLAIADGTFFDNEVLIATVEAAVASGGAVHLMGLLSDGGVHSHQQHLCALLRLALDRGARDIRVHCFLDGRDTPPESGLAYVEQLQAWIARAAAPDGRPAAERIGVSTVMGRYYAMDRDKRWERVERAWRCIVLGEGEPQGSAVEAVRSSYAAGVTDEFVAPVPVAPAGVAPSTVRDGDSVVFFNFRPDRARELTRAFVDPAFEGFPRPRTPGVVFACLTDYDPTIPAAVAFAKDLPCCTLADVLGEAGLSQLHIAETEKYAHVTFFLNGGAEQPKPGEERVLVSSPRIATYDLRPEMSARGVTDQLVEAIGGARADVYLVNFANLDMVGHTGVYEAAIEAVEVVDECLGRIVDSMREAGGELLITADHGNAERMVDADGTTPFTAHTTDAVPLLAVSERVSAVDRGGILADVAPSLAALVGIPCPPEWTGRSLLEIAPESEPGAGG
jgi:2,3-bisphosphoglycerate-independent phosphoglycerate mutase